MKIDGMLIYVNICCYMGSNYMWLQSTQPTTGGAVTAFFVKAGHADPVDGWHCSS